jgi:hypothetical protein
MSFQADPESIEQIRERLRKMSDLELRRYGRAARDLADPKRILERQIRPLRFSYTRREKSGGDGIRSTTYDTLRLVAAWRNGGTGGTRTRTHRFRKPRLYPFKLPPPRLILSRRFCTCLYPKLYPTMPKVRLKTPRKSLILRQGRHYR